MNKNDLIITFSRAKAREPHFVRLAFTETGFDGALGLVRYWEHSRGEIDLAMADIPLLVRAEQERQWPEGLDRRSVYVKVTGDLHLADFVHYFTDCTEEAELLSKAPLGDF